MINYCWDIRWEFYWNRKKIVTTYETTIVDGEIINGTQMPPTEVTTPVQNIFYIHSLAMFFELQDYDKKLVKYETVESILSETSQMLTMDEKASLTFSIDTQNKVKQMILEAKERYANFIPEVE